MGLTKRNIMYQYVINGVNVIGLVVSIYALIVELYKEAYPDYKPLCDISETVSCSKALMSRYGRGFGLIGPIFGEDHALNLRNPIMGIIFYILMFILASFNSVTSAKAFWWLAAISNIGSIYLAYIMYYYVQSWCIVCITLYVVNFVLLVYSNRRLEIIEQMARKKRD